MKLYFEFCLPLELCDSLVVADFILIFSLLGCIVPGPLLVRLCFV